MVHGLTILRVIFIISIDGRLGTLVVEIILVYTLSSQFRFSFATRLTRGKLSGEFSIAIVQMEYSGLTDEKDSDTQHAALQWMEYTTYLNDKKQWMDNL